MSEGVLVWLSIWSEVPLVAQGQSFPLTWQRGVVVSVVRRMNEVTLCRARLVLGWVTVSGRVYHHVT